MSELKLSSSRYDIDKKYNYILSILLSQDGLSFSVRDYLSNQFIHLEHYPDLNFQQNFAEIKAFIVEHLVNSSNYKEVYLILDDSRVSFVPNGFTGDDLNKAFFELNYPLVSEEELLTFSQKKTEITSVFPVNNEITTFFKKQFPDVKTLHLCDVALWYALSYHTSSGEHCMVITQKDSFYLIGIRDNKFLISNHFSYSSDDDFLFFLLNAFKQLNFDQYNAHIHLSGQISAKSTIVTKLKRFVKNVKFENWPTNFNYSDEFFTIPAHRFIHLLIASHCE